MRLIDAVSRMADEARLQFDPLPVIVVPPDALLSIRRIMERELGPGARLAMDRVGFMYDGVQFTWRRPRYRVKAGRQIVGGG
jgi:hypothetical protein